MRKDFMQITNEYVRGRMKVAEKLKGNLMCWYGTIMRREETRVRRKVMSIEDG